MQRVVRVEQRDQDIDILGVRTRTDLTALVRGMAPERVMNS